MIDKVGPMESSLTKATNKGSLRRWIYVRIHMSEVRIPSFFQHSVIIGSESHDLVIIDKRYKLVQADRHHRCGNIFSESFQLNWKGIIHKNHLNNDK